MLLNKPTSANEILEDTFLEKGKPAPYTGVLTSEFSYKQYESAFLQNQKCAENFLQVNHQDPIKVLSLESFVIGLGSGIIVEILFRSLLNK